jgi:hypothetical protein
VSPLLPADLVEWVDLAVEEAVDLRESREQESPKVERLVVLLVEHLRDTEVVVLRLATVEEQGPVDLRQVMVEELVPVDLRQVMVGELVPVARLLVMGAERLRVEGLAALVAWVAPVA